ncbi:5-methyltetrahydropteroyltriglutamate--homocysteine S-methyltransferase [Paramicrobacterium agarici]|uniref:5-methyltetrahydropteroyltriglutamate-- homocysteine S-methyltransferase n=1 Tax=Paramicrobacterium agarici TaxID=630514 RepID=UPI00114D54EB|nr:5-methyltetrahydropteroyltriglutamate--homocysteine S-methyltransferase [Microbacterium agarici]TQO22096.1 methionine synthase (B12-independent) [Microbacterium agarici]
MQGGSRSHAFPAGTVLGYPRLGRRRELTAALTAHAQGRLSVAELRAEADAIRSATRERLVQLGLQPADSSIPESFSLVDHVVDAAVAVGAIPRRFGEAIDPGGDASTASLMLARGTENAPPLNTAAWFGSLYRHFVPEIGPTTRFMLNAQRFVRDLSESRAAGYTTRPVIVGPVTLLRLSTADAGAPVGFNPLSRLADVVPVYAELLAKLRHAGAEWVQLDEPALVGEGVSERTLAAAQSAYTALGAAAGRPHLFVATAYGSIGDAFAALAPTRVEAIGVDLVSGELPSRLDNLTRARVAEKTIVAGVIDGGNVWRGDLARALEVAADVRRLSRSVAVSTSSSLIHVPHDVANEPELDARVARWLAFADQKVEQVAVVARGLALGSAAVASELRAASAALGDRTSAPGVRDAAVRERVAAVTAETRTRVPYTERRDVQRTTLGLPPLPTSTIGAFPQTDEIRAARTRYSSGVDSAEKYVSAMKQAIADIIAVQEQLGFDVLVHGEAERADMVTFFTENLEGFELTRNGWVQTTAGDCVRPAILWGDVSRLRPITVAWTRYAQSLTRKPLKGMLTGPATLLSLSFVRDDQPLADTAEQIALVLRDEIADLERAGLRIVQVDEPALAERLASGSSDLGSDWAVRAFVLATAGARAQTQVHAHVCTSHPGAVAAAIARLDADVTGFEAGRPGGRAIEGLGSAERDVSPGVYDVRSPRIPAVAEIEERLAAALEVVDADRLWVSPDCGLSARTYAEATPALGNLVEAAQRVRARLADRAEVTTR